MSAREPDSHKIRVGYSQMQALLDAYYKDASAGFPDEMAKVAGEVLSGDRADNLHHLLFGATLLNSLLMQAAVSGQFAGKTEAEILRFCGQVVNRQLELDSDPG